MTKFPLLAAGLITLLIGCHRAEGIAPPEPASTSNTHQVIPGRGGAPAQGTTPTETAPSRCIVAMAETALPQAKPATNCPEAPTASVPLTHGRATFVDASQKPSIDVELAQSSEDQERGLMYRTALAPESGMLFSWTGERIRTFWMHNTCLPLDMLFIARDGTIAGILEQVPVMNDEPRSIACPVSHVLEVNAGYCRKHGIAPGQHVLISTS